MQNNQAIYNMVISINKIALQNTIEKTTLKQAYNTTIKEPKGNAQNLYRQY
jgi:hypothetical protein